MTTSGYRAWLAAIRARAQQTCGGRIAVVTEGGYDLQALRACLDASVDDLHGPVANATTWRDAGGPDRRGKDTLQALQGHVLVAPRARRPCGRSRPCVPPPAPASDDMISLN